MNTQETAAVTAFANFVSLIRTPAGRAAFVADPSAAMQDAGSSLDDLPQPVATAATGLSEAELATLGEFEYVISQTELTMGIGPHTLSFL